MAKAKSIYFLKRISYKFNFLKAKVYLTVIITIVTHEENMNFNHNDF